jgi:DNA repair protein RadA/Sms
VFGEVGLSGEVRGIPQASLRVREAVQMGFTRIVMPAANVDPAEPGPLGGPAGPGGPEGEGCELVGVRTVGEALDQLIA